MITDGLELVSSHAYAEKGIPHDLWTRLRAESPVHYCEPEGFVPFWAITRHADICEISKQPEIFSSASGIAMVRAGSGGGPAPRAEPGASARCG